MNKAILILSILIFIVGCTNNHGKYDSFAKCLKENRAAMYGTEWCSHCKNQKEMFGKSFQFVQYVDCDKYKIACSTAGVKGYPTWVINGTHYPGEQQLDKLAELTGCQLSED